MSSVLRVTNMTKDFGGLRAVDDVSFEIGKGEFVGLIGPNGCGKTTTFNCISGLLDATEGDVEVFGEDATLLRTDQIQNLGITRTFQHTRLWREMTTIENLLIPPRNQYGTDPIRGFISNFFRGEEEARVRKAYSTLEELEITHMAHNLTSELSGGQSKLVDIGRALMGEPELLLLDEPVAGVDYLKPIFREHQGMAPISSERSRSKVGRIMTSGMAVRWGSPTIVTSSSETSSGPEMVLRPSSFGGTGRLSKAGVSISPGLTTVALILVLANSDFKNLVNAMIEAFTVLYIMPPINPGSMPAIDATLIIVPLSRFNIPGKTACEQ